MKKIIYNLIFGLAIGGSVLFSGCSQYSDKYQQKTEINHKDDQVSSPILNTNEVLNNDNLNNQKNDKDPIAKK